MPGPKPKRTSKEIIEAIHETKGIVSVAARRLGISRKAIYDARDKYKGVAEALEDAREAMTDFAEGQLYKNIQKGDTTSIIFYLKTQGKARGYVERQEVDNRHQIEGVLGIDVHLPPDADDPDPTE